MAGDIFDELVGPAGASPADLIAALRRQRNLGRVGALSGDKNIQQLGGSEYDDSIKQATGIRDRRDTQAARDFQQNFAERQQAGLEGDRAANRDFRNSQLKQARELAEKQMRNQREIAGLRGAANGGTPFQKKYEQQVATDAAAWDTGGKIQAGSARNDISNAISKLEEDKTIGNSMLSGLPGDEWIRSKLDPKGLEVQRLANRVTVENLRNTFGAQFTENEGRSFKALDYDPALCNEQNQANLKKKLALIDAHTRRKNELYGKYREDDMPDYGAPDTLGDDDILRAIMAEGE